jgi:hypothetical protein
VSHLAAFFYAMTFHVLPWLGCEQTGVELYEFSLGEVKHNSSH